MIMKKNVINRRETISLLFGGLIGMTLIGKDRKTFTNIFNKSINKMNKKQNTEALKTIGILGGIGPQATMDLEMRIHRSAQKIISPQENAGYPPMIVQYYRHAPVLLTGNHQPVFPFQVDPRLLDTAKNIGRVADFLLIASNGIHLFQNDIENASGRKVLSMIDLTIEEVMKRNWKKVGVLGLMNARIYSNPLQASGIICETIDSNLQEKLNRSIFKVMEGQNGEEDKNIAMEAIHQLRSKNVNGIIPGCTEIPFLLEGEMNSQDLINPVQILAEAAVRYSMQ